MHNVHLTFLFARPKTTDAATWIVNAFCVHILRFLEERLDLFVYALIDGVLVIGSEEWRRQHNRTVPLCSM